MSKWAPRSDMGIWVGVAHETSHSARVVPIKWDIKIQSWTLGAPIIATRVKVYDTIFPLSMNPDPSNPTSSAFDTFINGIIQPLFRVAESDPVVALVPEPDSVYENTDSDEEP